MERGGGAGEEGASRPREHRDGEHHREPPEELLEARVHAAVPVARVERDAEQHHLHPEQRRDPEPPDAGAALRLDGRFFRVRRVGGRAVPCLGKGFEEGVDAGSAGVEVDLRAAKGEVDGGGGYLGDRHEEALDEPSASRAAHAFDGEGDGGGGGRGSGVPAGLGTGGVVVIGTAIVPAPQQARLDFGDAPCFELGAVAGVGGGGALRVGVGAQAIPGVESSVRDGFDRGAAGVAACPYILARNLDRRRLGAEGRTAMMATRCLPKFRGRKNFSAQELLPVRNPACRLRQAFHQGTVVQTLPLQPLEPARVSIAKAAPSRW